MKMQLDKRNGVTSGGNGKDVADNNNGDSGQDSSKTRKKSDKNMENYRKIVIADDSEADQRYKSDYRGRVQDRNVTIKLEPMYALTYYEKLSDVKRIVHYHKYIDELNHSKLLPAAANHQYGVSVDRRAGAFPFCFDRRSYIRDCSG